MKEKKITINPFLNERVAPKTRTVNLDGVEIEVEYFPLYYQIIYDRKNTHLAAARAFGDYEDPYYFSSLNKDAKDYFVRFSAKDIIKRDSRLIELIIRYLSSKNQHFEIRGIKSMFDTFEKNLFVDLNEKMKFYLMVQLEERNHLEYTPVLNFRNEGLSFYYMFTTMQKLFNVLDVYTSEEINHIQNLKYFFEIYQTEFELKHMWIENHKDNILGAPFNNAKYSIIQWIMDDMDEEFKTVLKKHKHSEESINSIKNSINWIMKYNDIPFSD